MSKKLWNWFYLKPVDHLDILRSENIDKGRKMHEAISKRMKELIASGPPLKFVGPTEPICFMHYADADNVFDMVPEYIKQCDCEMKILKNRTPTEPVAEWHIASEAKFDENIIKNLHVVCDGPTGTGKIEKLQINKPNKNGDVFPNTATEVAKLQINGRKLRTEKIPANKKYDFVNFSWVSDPIDPRTKIKSVNPQGEQILSPNDIPTKQENKSSQVSICSSCNYYNEWIPFDPDYKCYKCKKGL